MCMIALIIQQNYVPNSAIIPLCGFKVSPGHLKTVFFLSSTSKKFFPQNGRTAFTHKQHQYKAEQMGKVQQLKNYYYIIVGGNFSTWLNQKKLSYEHINHLFDNEIQSLPLMKIQSFQILQMCLICNVLLFQRNILDCTFSWYFEKYSITPKLSKNSLLI